VGVNVSVEELRGNFDAILLSGGATAPRDLPVPGRDLRGIHFAMEYLPLQNKRCEGDTIPDSQFITAKEQARRIIGGGDTERIVWELPTGRAHAPSFSSNCFRSRLSSAPPTIPGPTGRTSSEHRQHMKKR